MTGHRPPDSGGNPVSIGYPCINYTLCCKQRGWTEGLWQVK